MTTGSDIADSNRLPTRPLGRTPWPLDIDRPRLSVLAQASLEAQCFIEARTLAIPRERRNVHEHLGASIRRRDETESPVVVPPAELSLDTHRSATKRLFFLLRSKALSYFMRTVPIQTQLVRSRQYRGSRR